MYLPQNGILMSSISEYGSFILLQYTLQVSDEIKIGEDTPLAVDPFVMNNPTILIQSVTGKLESDLILRMHTFAKWNCHHTCFKIDEVQRGNPAVHFTKEIWIHPFYLVILNSLLDLQQLALIQLSAETGI